MNIRTSTALWILGGLAALYVIVYFSITSFGVSPEDLNSLDLDSTLAPFRVIGYLVVVAAWPWIARRATQPRARDGRLDEKMKREWAEATALVAARQWKVALFFALFEIIVIQRGFTS